MFARRRRIRNPSAYAAAVRRNTFSSGISARRSMAISAARDTLTGGTKDVNPQWYKGYVTLSAADTISEANFQLPITRIPTANKVTIIEVLKVQVEFPSHLNTAAAATQGTYEQQVNFSTTSLGTAAMATIDNRNVFAKLSRWMQKAFTAAGSYAVSDEPIKTLDLTDGAGHGLLIASDKLYVQADSTLETADIDSFKFALLYRFKTVGMREYVGIVQSQQ